MAGPDNNLVPQEDRDREEQRIKAVGALIGLSPRESAIVALVHVEAPDKLIARMLGNSEHTVRTHLGRIFRKLKVQTRAGCAVAWERAAVSLAGIADSGKRDATEKRKRRKL